MTVKQILTPIIEQEFRKYESNGYKVKLKTPRKRRITYTVCCVLITFLYFFLFKDSPNLIMLLSIPLFIFIAIKLFKQTKEIVLIVVLCFFLLTFISIFLSNGMFIPVILIVYIILMSRTNKYDTIISLAKKMPDTPIDQVIAQEITLDHSTSYYNTSGNSTIRISPKLISTVLVVLCCIAGIGLLYNIFGGYIHTACSSFVNDIYSITGKSNISNNSETSTIQRSEDNTYEKYNDGYKLVSCGSQDMNSTSIIIPKQYEGLDIVAIGYCAFSGFNNLETIEIPNSVTEIDKRAFENCSKLNNVIIPDSVTTIRGGAFMNCTSLTDITFGNGITAIEGECFKGCTSLAEFTVPKTVTEIRGYCFEGCTSLKSVSLHNQITAIHAYAFTGCTSLEEITLPENITEIRANTFENCTSLKEISIPNGVTRIAAHSFRNCSSLYKAEIPDSVTEIGSSAFRNCKSLMRIELPQGAVVNERAFKDSPTKIIYK